MQLLLIRWTYIYAVALLLWINLLLPNTTQRISILFTLPTIHLQHGLIQFYILQATNGSEICPEHLFIKLLICIWVSMQMWSLDISPSHLPHLFASLELQKMHFKVLEPYWGVEKLMKNITIKANALLRLSSVCASSVFINRPLAFSWHYLSKKPFTNLMKGELLHSANSAERKQSAATAPHFILLFHLKQGLMEVVKLRQNLPSNRND